MKIAGCWRSLLEHTLSLLQSQSFSGKEKSMESLPPTGHNTLHCADVYLGAPCAVPLDPRHRLVVPKYNPARTFTPEVRLRRCGGNLMDLSGRLITSL